MHAYEYDCCLFSWPCKQGKHWFCQNFQADQQVALACLMLHPLWAGLKTLARQHPGLDHLIFAHYVYWQTMNGQTNQRETQSDTCMHACTHMHTCTLAYSGAWDGGERESSPYVAEAHNAVLAEQFSNGSRQGSLSTDIQVGSSSKRRGSGAGSWSRQSRSCAWT